MFPEVSIRGRVSRLGRLVSGRVGRTRTGTSNGGTTPRKVTRVNVSSFTGIRLHATGVLRYRPIGGSGGLLGVRTSSNASGPERVISNVSRCCGPRSLVNGAIVVISGLGPTGLYNRVDGKVLLTNSTTSNKVGILFTSNVRPKVELR